MNVVTLDIGNSDIKFGLFLNGALAKFWRASDFAPVHQYKRPEHFSNALRAGLASIGHTFEGLVYSTVVPEMEYILKKTLQYCFTVRTPVVAIRPGMARLPLEVVGYPSEQLGIDRLVTACGAHLMYPNQHMILADFGTATTFDVITANGKFLGGVIAPGIETYTSMLPQRASQLPYVPFGPCQKAIGQNTQECMQAGVSFGYLGMVKEIIQHIELELQSSYGIGDAFAPEQNILRLATGGGAESFLKAFPGSDLFSLSDPTMTIKGLYALYLESTYPNKRRIAMMDALKPNASKPQMPKAQREIPFETMQQVASKVRAFQIAQAAQESQQAAAELNTLLHEEPLSAVDAPSRDDLDLAPPPIEHMPESPEVMAAKLEAHLDDFAAIDEQAPSSLQDEPELIPYSPDLSPTGGETR